MKYFTPDRFIRLQDRTNEGATRAAMQEWEAATSRYGLHIEQLLPGLPKAVLSFLKSGSLHDAEVIAVWQKNSEHLHIMVQQERESAKAILLAYALASPPRINTAVLPECYRTPTPTWLYDEIDLASGPAPRVSRRTSKRGRETVFSHAILLSNGSELQLRFHRLTVSDNTVLLPGLAQGRSALGGVIPRSG